MSFRKALQAFNDNLPAPAIVQASCKTPKELVETVFTARALVKCMVTALRAELEVEAAIKRFDAPLSIQVVLVVFEQDRVDLVQNPVQPEAVFGQAGFIDSPGHVQAQQSAVAESV